MSTTTMREVFARVLRTGLAEDPRIAAVIAEISRDVLPDHERVVNVGIREQAMVGVGAGLALTGLRPVVHSYAPFLVERPYEQLKLDLGHQDLGAVLVGIGGSYDDPGLGRTHQSPADVALIDTLPGWTVHVPGHPDEVEPLLTAALARDDRTYLRLSLRTNAAPLPVVEGFTEVRRGGAGVVIAVGPVLDDVLAAVSDLDVTVLYATTVRPFDSAGLRRAVAHARPDVLLVEPYLEGTSAHRVAAALADEPHRLRSLGVRRDEELRAYGTTADHDSAHELDPVGIREAARRLFGRR
ncbi:MULTISPECIES: transketolase family protein [Actinosynnema]|uniref:transketolase family protein n=1 Tax=Actinosynnema TaxID=40566 RepID=UPI0020A33CE1|nr:transketolase [Actinosynnema pretiosum]MCP2094174.1 transketolase subunit B [Actinosynnema pretiosum]